MNEAYAITAENLLRVLPEALRNDEEMYALAVGIAGQLAARPSEIDAARIYTRIDELPESLLDILAYDFKIDWWDPDYSLAEKRQIFKESWAVHRILGTKAAVETTISVIYPDTQVMEWFEYGGEPFHFKLLIDATFEDVDPQKHARVIRKVDFYKNLRSVLDEVEYSDTGGTATAYAAAIFAGCTIVDGATAELY